MEPPRARTGPLELPEPAPLCPGKRSSGLGHPQQPGRKKRRLQEEDHPRHPTECPERAHALKSDLISDEKSFNPDRKGTQSDQSSQVRSAPSPSREKFGQRGSGSSNRSSRARVHTINPIAHWIQKGNWPRVYFEPDHTMTRPSSKRSWSTSQGRTHSTLTPTDHKPNDDKSAAYRDSRYEHLLAAKGSFMNDGNLDYTNTRKTLCGSLLDTQQQIPLDSLFRDDLFLETCRKVQNKNEARIVRDISPLITPSAETLVTYGAAQLGYLIEGVSQGWNQSIAFEGPRPQPDYSLAFRSTAFSAHQLRKLEPYIGGFRSTSLFMGTDEMYFPFFTSEVKCGNQGLDVADRQNAHSMTISVRGIAELYRIVNRPTEINGEILGISISHNHRGVRIYGHYPVIEEKKTTFYRHQIHSFDISALDGQNKWTAYKFTRNVYDIFVPSHLKRIHSAVDQLPEPNAFDLGSLALNPTLTEVQSESHGSQGVVTSAASSQSPATFKKPRRPKDGGAATPSKAAMSKREFFETWMDDLGYTMENLRTNVELQPMRLRAWEKYQSEA